MFSFSQLNAFALFVSFCNDMNITDKTTAHVHIFHRHIERLLPSYAFLSDKIIPCHAIKSKQKHKKMTGSLPSFRNQNHSIFRLSLLAHEEQCNRTRTGMRTDRRSDIINHEVLHAKALLNLISHEFCILQCVSMADKDIIVLILLHP